MPILMPLKIESVASVMTKALMPVTWVRTPFKSPQSAPSSRPSVMASGIGRPQASMLPAKVMATRPPMAPTERLSWPMAMITIWAKATSAQSEKLKSST